jgi:hypothetical protein
VRWLVHGIAVLLAGIFVPAVIGGCGRSGFDVRPDAAMPDAVPDAVPDVVPDVIDPCAVTYMMIGQSSYRFTATPVSWDVAEHACEADGRGTHLVVFNDALEMNKIEAILNDIQIWVGITDRISDKNFVDVMGETPMFLPDWQDMGPSFPGPGCVQFNPSSRLIHDQACDTQVAYVCECDGIPAQPASY